MLTLPPGKLDWVWRPHCFRTQWIQIVKSLLLWIKKSGQYENSPFFPQHINNKALWDIALFPPQLTRPQRDSYCLCPCDKGYIQTELSFITSHYRMAGEFLYPYTTAAKIRQFPYAWFWKNSRWTRFMAYSLPFTLLVLHQFDKAGKVAWVLNG